MIFVIGFTVVVTFVATSFVYTFIVTPKAEQELQEQLDEALDLIEDQRAEIKALLNDNKRMLKTLNHYQIKKTVPIYPSEEVRRNG